MTEQLTPHRTDSPRPRVSFAELPTVYPTTSLLLAIFLTAGGLLLAWTAVRIGWGFDAEVYKAGLMGLAAATTAHVLGTFAGAFLAPTQGSLLAYFASTVVRFLLTPTLALSLYFALPMQPKALLIGAAVGYVIILVADIGTMLKASSRLNATGQKA